MADVLERMNADTLAEQITLIGVLLNSSTPDATTDQAAKIHAMGRVDAVTIVMLA